MNPDETIPGPLGRVARGVAVVMLTYWGVFALVCPVLTIDSQVYNLARVELALRDGLFDNRFFTSVFHVMYPWAFDTVHLPFLLLGWGFALPSYLCLIGTCLAVHPMIRVHLGAEAAWAAILALLAMPCLVYQATATKNDIPLLFAGAVWVYARWRWRREGGDWHLAWMALSIGLMAGAKTTGLIPAALLSAWTLWEVRASRALIFRIGAGLVGVFLLFGSVETYLENARQYGHPFGPPALLQRASNQAGLKGTAANFIRHSAGGVYAGPTDFRDGQMPVARLNDATRQLLAGLALTNAGTDARFPDSELFLHQNGHEELSGFGPVGTLAMLAMLAVLFTWKHRATLWWRLAGGGLLGLLLASATLAYTPWAKRYLLPWYAFGALAVVCLLWATNSRWRSGLRWFFLAIAAFSAMAAPFWSFNRSPRALLGDRERLETSAYPVVGLVRDSLRRLLRESLGSRIFIVTHDETVLLPLLTDGALAALPVTRAGFQDLLEHGQVKPADLIVMESPPGNSALTLVEKVTAPNVFSFSDTRTQFIYRFVPPAL